jgi:triacylglycerol esterase/lipase EstA (alpha/beta hydrolase family)
MRQRLAAIAVSIMCTVGTLGVPVALRAAPAAAATANPVLIVAGTFSPEFVVYPLRDRLRADGFTVYTMALPGGGTGDIAASSAAVRTKVDSIRAATGAAKVDLIGHSQGGLENRYYLKFLGGTSKVGTYVSLGTPQYGTAVANLASFLGFGNCLSVTACVQMTIGSSFLANLNAGDDTPGSVRYVSIYTAVDELVQPYNNARINDGATNVLLQSHCWWKLTGHIGLVADGAVYGLVRSALRGGTVSTNCFAL